MGDKSTGGFGFRFGLAFRSGSRSPFRQQETSELKEAFERRAVKGAARGIQIKASSDFLEMGLV